MGPGLPLELGTFKKTLPLHFPCSRGGGVRDGATDVGLVHCGTSGPTWKLKGAISASSQAQKETQFGSSILCPFGAPAVCGARELPPREPCPPPAPRPLRPQLLLQQASRCRLSLVRNSADSANEQAGFRCRAVQARSVNLLWAAPSGQDPGPILNLKGRR